MAKEIHKHRVVITQRDNALFLYLFKNKVANFKQIHRDIFSNISVQTTYRRVGKLIKEGWVEGVPYMKGKRTARCFSITKKCLNEQLREYIEVEYGHLRSDSITHDLRLNDIRSFFLLKKYVSSYFTENELASNSDLKEDSEISSYCSVRVDSVVQVTGESGDIYYLGVEYEHTLKSKKRCRQKVKGYYLSQQTEAILFIYSNKEIYNCFIEIEKEFSKEYSPKLFFLSIKDIDSDKQEVTFRNIHGDIIEIK